MVGKYLNRYRIETTRLKHYDYGKSGAYFITICTKSGAHHFVKIDSMCKMQYSPIGISVRDCWHIIPTHFSFVHLGEYVVMPNHIHGILIFDKKDGDTKSCVSTDTQNLLNPAGNRFGPQSRNLASVVRGFKIGVTNYARKNTDIDTVWQSRYHDRVIRNEFELARITEYIKANPKNWVFRNS